jgi:hypothetical protein
VNVVQWLVVIVDVSWYVVGAWSIDKWGVVSVTHCCWKINVLRGLVVMQVVAIADCDVSVYAGVILMCVGVRFQNLSSRRNSSYLR